MGVHVSRPRGRFPVSRRARTAGTVTAAEPSWLTVPTLYTGDMPIDLSAYVTNWDAGLYEMDEVTSKLAAANVSLSTAGVLTYSGSGGASQTGVQIEVVDSAEADWTARISDPGVVWYHDFRSDAEVDQFCWAGLSYKPAGWPGGWSGNDPQKLNTEASMSIRNPSDGITGGCLEQQHNGTAGDGAYWWRPFTPFASGHGRAVADPAAGGTITTRAWAPTEGGNETSQWGEGFYGHPSAGGALKDGHDFYVQIRCKMDPRRITGGNDAFTVGKFIWFNTCAASLSQGEHVVYSYGPGGNDGDKNYFRAYCYRTTNLGGGFDALAPGGDIQPGYAGTDWSWSGGWDTILLHLRPGLIGVTSGTDATLLEAWAAKPGQTSYTKIFTLEYGVAQWEGNNGGLQSLLLSSYNNGNNFPQPFWHRYAQIIFSKAFIAIPNDPVQRGIA